MNAFEKAAARREEKREEKYSLDLIASASRFSSSAQISDEELEGIRRWEGAAAADAAIAASRERGRYTKIARTAAPKGTATPLDPSAAPAPAGPNNFFSTLALVFGVLGGVLGIVFGIVALSEIRRTGEPGEGNARSGIILGCLWFTVLFLVYLFVPVD